jgi:hypothetical protein
MEAEEARRCWFVLGSSTVEIQVLATTFLRTAVNAQRKRAVK